METLRYRAVWAGFSVMISFASAMTQALIPEGPRKVYVLGRLEVAKIRYRAALLPWEDRPTTHDGG